MSHLTLFIMLVSYCGLVQAARNNTVAQQLRQQVVRQGEILVAVQSCLSLGLTAATVLSAYYAGQEINTAYYSQVGDYSDSRHTNNILFFGALSMLSASTAFKFIKGSCRTFAEVRDLKTRPSSRS